MEQNNGRILAAELVGTAVLRYTGVLRTVEDLVLTRYSTSKDSEHGNALPVVLELRRIRRADRP